MLPDLDPGAADARPGNVEAPLQPDASAADAGRWRAQAEQHAGELALIDAIQRGIAGRLSFQGIVDLLGEKLAALFAIRDLSIRWWDAEANTTEILFGIEHGQPLPKRGPTPLKAGGPAERLLRTGVGGFYGTQAEQVAAGIVGATPGTDWCLSIMAAPIRGTQRVLGHIVLEDHEREHAFAQADLQALTTIGSTLGTALENARLFDETQRLLKETEQRNAELAVINSIQQGVAGSLSFQAIVELVGDKLREVLRIDTIGIRWYDYTTRTVHFLYENEHGEPVTIASVTPSEARWNEVTSDRSVVVRNTAAEVAAAGVGGRAPNARCRR